MARYTELFSEWLEAGGVMPAVFDTVEIDGVKLTDIFKAKYAAREIGFKTPTLFELKLNEYTAVLMPELNDGLAGFRTAVKAMSNPIKEHVKTGQIERIYGEAKRNTWDNPTPSLGSAGVDLSDAGSQNITIDKERTDRENYAEVTDTDTGVTASEGLAVYQALSQPAQSFLQIWLNKFDALFMQIF